MKTLKKCVACHDHILFFTMYRTVEKKNTKARKISSLSVTSRLLYFVSSFLEFWMCPDMLRNSSLVPVIVFDEDSKTKQTIAYFPTPDITNEDGDQDY